MEIFTYSAQDASETFGAPFECSKCLSMLCGINPVGQLSLVTLPGNHDNWIVCTTSSHNVRDSQFSGTRADISQYLHRDIAATLLHRDIAATLLCSWNKSYVRVAAVAKIRGGQLQCQQAIADKTCTTYRSKCVELNPFRTPKSLPILT